MVSKPYLRMEVGWYIRRLPKQVVPDSGLDHLQLSDGFLFVFYAVEEQIDIRSRGQLLVVILAQCPLAHRVFLGNNQQWGQCCRTRH